MAAACRNCGNHLCKGETKCFTCDTPVLPPVNHREVNLARVRVTLTIMFFLFVGMTIASLFTDMVPSFAKCAAITVILHFVKEAAVQMSEPKGS